MHKILALVSMILVLSGAGLAPAQAGYVGVFIPMQNPIVDAIVDARTGDQYFMPVWSAYKKGRVSGAEANVRVFLSTNNEQMDIYNGPVSGHQYFRIDNALVKTNTYLCVETPWAIIAHQQVASGDKVACTRSARELHDWFSDGRGRTPEDAWGIIAIAPAGI